MRLRKGPHDVREWEGIVLTCLSFSVSFDRIARFKLILACLSVIGISSLVAAQAAAQTFYEWQVSAGSYPKWYDSPNEAADAYAAWYCAQPAAQGQYADCTPDYVNLSASGFPAYHTRLKMRRVSDGGTMYTGIAGIGSRIDPVQPGEDKQNCCPVSNSQGGAMFGNPINAGNGNKSQIESDYSATGGLQLQRAYNSKATVSGAFGSRWRHTFERAVEYRLIGLSTYIARVIRPNGRIFTFTPSGTGWQSEPDVAATLSWASTSSGLPQSWTFIDSDITETYDAAGRLTLIELRTGYAQSLTYDGQGRLATVTDSFGRQLQFGYDSQNRITSVNAPGSTTYGYSYASSGMLASVTYPDSTERQYLYNESVNTSGAILPWALTGIIDESLNRLATFKYNSAGRAILTEHAGGANRVSIAYNSNDTTTVTSALGNAQTYSFQSLFGIRKATSITGVPSLLAGQYASYSYDPAGNMNSRTDALGNKTSFVYDTERSLEISRTEAVGTLRERTITTEWNSAYRLPTRIDEPNKRTTYVHDASGNVLSRTTTDLGSTPNLSRTWSFTYDTFGRVLSEDGPRSDVSDVTTYTYYSCATGYHCGQLHTATNAAGHVTTYSTYNAHGQPLTITDPNDVVTTLTYDLRQRLTSRTVGTEVTTFEYWPTGLLKKATQPDGSLLEYTYDAAHRLTGINDSEGNRIEYTLDAMGNRTAENLYDPTNALTRTQTRVFNTLNQLWKEIGAAGTTNVTTTYGYDNNGNQTSVDAPLGRNTGQGYDELNRLTQITDPLSGLTQYGYNALDQLIAVTDPRNLTTAYTYNALGDLKQQTSPDTGITTNTYDSGGNLATSTDARGAVSTYTYDALNRVATASFATGANVDPTLTYTYDTGTHGNGRLTGVADSNHALSWTYDAQGRVVTAGQAVGSVSKTTSYSYANGLRQSMTTPSGQVVTYGYTNGKITSVSVNGTLLVSGILYEPFGPVRQWTWANGALAVRTFDQDGKVTQIDSEVLKAYSYDDAFRITGIADASNAALSWTYGYDDLDRLTSASNTGTTLGYTYDVNGNRLTQTGTAASTFTMAANSNRLLSTSGALTRTYGYDNAGNTTSFTGLTFTYNNRGRMSSSTKSGVTTSYIYNALGQLIKKGTNTLYYYDEAGHVLGTYTGSGALVEEIVWLGDIPIISLRPKVGGGINIYNIHTDHLNTPRLITGSVNPGIRWRWDAEPFGGGTVNNNPSGAGVFDFHLRFPGQIYVAETGLNYNYFRDYDPSTGRYAQSDPIGLGGGLNVYGYVNGNPVSFLDPQGLELFLPNPGRNTVICDGNGSMVSQLQPMSPLKLRKCVQRILQ
ncbi:RHS repeat-associated core domain-containing protein [Steroidobacter cummioxidans]|uniref:RHS repeat-associated core domain-containing protein n=1 Tax=Steroidobacter cummioxidans TaxID=1803913 RepID=UPI000E313474|nr:RHS repeat-associated core domain-containing protein [Steroidobacter cummioxidans]